MLFERLQKIWANETKPFLVNDNNELRFEDLKNITIDGLDDLKKGDVIALIGDFDPETISTLLKLLDLGMIVVPLTFDTENQHEYFFKESKAQYIFNKNKFIKKISNDQINNKLLNSLRVKQHPGLILFTTGTTGLPKAILHDFIPFFNRYKTPRPSLKALSFLLFDHIGGINTLFHILFNKGTVVSIYERTVENVLKTCEKFSIELLPTTPTFLRLLSLYPEIKKVFPKSVKIISYGTERMDQPTLKNLCEKLPNVDLRQTYGMSELGILRIKSLSKDSLYMKIGGEGIETKIEKNILFIKAENRMVGYLNASSPFDKEGWYCTKDIVEIKDNNFIKIIGRDSDVINVGGLKFFPSEIEKICFKFKGIKHVKALSKENPITGQHVELIIEELNNDFDEKTFKEYLKKNLPKHMFPLRIIYKKLKLSHRFKKI